MKKILLFAAAALPLLLSAQLGLRMEFNRKDFMLYEPVYVCITIRNDSGKALLFGSNPKLQGFILFDIRDRKNNRIPQRKDSELNVTGLFLGPGETKSITIPLHKYYDLDRTGMFQVRAYVSHNLLEHEYQVRDSVFIRIHSGVEFKRITVGIPDLSAPDKHKPARSRTYSIRSLDISGERCYYLVVEDEHRVYGVTHIGYQFGHNELQVQTDMLSRVHILVPMSPKVFHYLTFGLDGTNIESSYWKKGGTVPTLYRDPASGKVSRIGGDPARPGIDFRTSDQNRYTTDELNRHYMATPDNPRKNTGVVDIGRHVGKEK
ncbi:MAG: hypothetical protein IJU70_02865 [Lentisphaeria bacterium]|nr:hypothetical protein [Lentisphaeria bacterium]